MKLTEDQIATVKSWIESGEDLGTIQKKIHENFDLNLTFLETRFLLSDLKLEFAEEEEEEEEEEVVVFFCCFFLLNVLLMFCSV